MINSKKYLDEFINLWNNEGKNTLLDYKVRFNGYKLELPLPTSKKHHSKYTLDSLIEPMHGAKTFKAIGEDYAYKIYKLNEHQLSLIKIDRKMEEDDLYEFFGTEYFGAVAYYLLLLVDQSNISGVISPEDILVTPIKNLIKSKVNQEGLSRKLYITVHPTTDQLILDNTNLIKISIFNK